VASSTRRIGLILGAVGILALLVVLKVGVLGGNSGPRGVRTAAGNEPGAPLSVTTTVIKTERLSDRVTSVGTIRANEEVEIRSEVSGKVVSILFNEGTRVRKDQLLLKINDSELRAQLARADARLAIAQGEADRQHQLFEQSLTSEREYDNAGNELDAARADVQLIHAQLAKAEIHAPFDGVIGLRSVSEGSYVTPSMLIATLRDDTPVKIDFSVPERYASLIKAGDHIDFTVQGVTQTFGGSIYALESSIDTATRTLRVRATSPNPDGALVPGAFADVSIVLAERDALTVPAYALIPELNGHRVFVYSAGKAESRSVDIGTRSDERVEIVHGLDPGDTLITSAILQLKPGTAVAIAGVD
jgi:membrane fusion protein, multidrug efflux system